MQGIERARENTRRGQEKMEARRLSGDEQGD